MPRLKLTMPNQKGGDRDLPRASLASDAAPNASDPRTSTSLRPSSTSSSAREKLKSGKKSGKNLTGQGDGLGSRSQPIPASSAADAEETPRRRTRSSKRGLLKEQNKAETEAQDLYNTIRQNIIKAKEKNDKQAALAQQLAALNEKIGKSGRDATRAEIDQLDSLHRQILKLSEEEKSILSSEGPDAVIKNLELLIALRSASEQDNGGRGASGAKPRKQKAEAKTSAVDSLAPSSSAAPDKLNRVKANSQRSGSSSGARGRESLSAGADDVPEATKGSVAEEVQFSIDQEVVYKDKKQQTTEAEGIQCTIRNITGEGHKKRYEIEDAERNKEGKGQIYKTYAASLTPIPEIGAPLPSFPVGKQVIARYPDTTTFYRAWIVQAKKDVYYLRFEDDDRPQQEVDKRFVLEKPEK